MLAYTIYSEAGGVGKTTLAASLATAHADHGRDVLAIDLDPQQGSLTYLLGVDAPRGDGDADNIGRHLIDRPLGEFDDLVHETGSSVSATSVSTRQSRLPTDPHCSRDAGTSSTPRHTT